MPKHNPIIQHYKSKIIWHYTAKQNPLLSEGFMMGLWFLASAFGQHLAGLIGAHMSVPHDAGGMVVPAIQSLHIYMEGCKQIAMVSLGGGY